MTLLAKWRFILELASDPRLSRADLVIGLLLLDLFNAAKGYAWPSFDWLASAAQVDRSTATRSVRHLISLGHFERTSGGGRGRANHYRPWFGDAENRRVGATHSAKKQAQQRTETGASAHQNRCADAPKQARGRAARPNRHTFKNPTRESAARTADGDYSTGPEVGLGDIEQPQQYATDWHRRQLKCPRKAETATSASRDLQDWQPSPETVAWASEHAAAVVDPTGPAVVEKFRNYWLARGRQFHDIDAAFRKWLCDEHQYTIGKGQTRRDKILDRATRAAQAVHRGTRDC